MQLTFVLALISAWWSRSCVIAGTFPFLLAQWSAVAPLFYEHSYQKSSWHVAISCKFWYLDPDLWSYCPYDLIRRLWLIESSARIEISKHFPRELQVINDIWSMCIILSPWLSSSKSFMTYIVPIVDDIDVDSIENWFHGFKIVVHRCIVQSLFIIASRSNLHNINRFEWFYTQIWTCRSFS